MPFFIPLTVISLCQRHKIERVSMQKELDKLEEYRCYLLWVCFIFDQSYFVRCGVKSKDSTCSISNNYRFKFKPVANV